MVSCMRTISFSYTRCMRCRYSTRRLPTALAVQRVHVHQRFGAVGLVGVEQSVDGPLAAAGDGVGLAVVPEEVVQEVVADDIAAGVALVAQGVGDEALVRL